MRVVLLANTSSGKGRAAAVVATLVRAMRRDGHDVEMARVGRGDLADHLRGAQALVVAGGDGTIHHALDDVLATGVPIYHVPIGTENLFAREFGMDRDPRRLLGALGTSPHRVDVGTCNGRTFALMASAGPDAAVIHRLSRSRTGPITHLSYVRPILAELAAMRLPRLTVRVDGRAVVEARQGSVVVGNCRQYGGHLNPALRASMTDGLLDVVFFPAHARLGILRWLLLARLRRHTTDRSLVYEQGRTVKVESDSPFPIQLDGEPGGVAAVMELTTRPVCLAILRASDHGTGQQR